MPKKIVGVQYKTKDGFSSREYSYYVAEGVELKVGDMVMAPTKDGDVLVRVARLDIPESEIKHIEKYMRVIEKQPLTDEQLSAREQPQKLNRSAA